MTNDELTMGLKRLEEKLDGGNKSPWDKAAVIGTVASGVLVPLALAVAGFYFSSVLSEQQIRTSREIASDNLRLGQYQLAAGLMKSLSSPEARERKQAISFVFIVLPELEARRLVDVLSQSDPDPAVRSSATNALNARLTELTVEAAGSDPEQSQRATSHLSNVWKDVPQFTKTLLDSASQHKANQHAQANTVNLLNTLDTRKLKQHSNEVAELIRRTPSDNAQFQQNARMLNQKLQSRE